MSEMALEDVIEVLIDHRGRTPKKLGGDFTESGVKVISALLVKDGKINLTHARHVSIEMWKEWMPVPLKKGDVILTSEAPLGRCALVPDNDAYVLGQRVFGIRGRPDKLDNRFLYYALQSESLQQQLLSRSSGTTVTGIRQSELKKVLIPTPGLDQQCRIASVLGALDDKIAVNERIADTTDNLVAVMFDELLRFAHEPCTLGDVAVVNKKSVKPPNEGSLRYVDISSVGIGQYVFPERTEWKDAPGRARRKAVHGDTIWSTVRPNRRSHALVLDSDPDLVFSTGLAILSPTSVGPAFLYESTRTQPFQAYLESVAEGSAYPAVQADKFNAAPISLPSADKRDHFERMAMSLRKRAHKAITESRTLAALRNTLLPQLMSGRIRVRDAERIVEDST